MPCFAPLKVSMHLMYTPLRTPPFPPPPHPPIPPRFRSTLGPPSVHPRPTSPPTHLQREAERMLTRDNEFLIRLSQQQPGALTISLRGGPGLFIHTSVAMEDHGFKVQVEDEASARRYNDLKSLVAESSDVLQASATGAGGGRRGSQ